MDDDKWFEELRKRRSEEWKAIIVDGVKPEYQGKYLKEVS